MDKAVIYIHGKGGNAEEAIHYKPLFSNCDVIGLDYIAQFPWEAKEEIAEFEELMRKTIADIVSEASSVACWVYVQKYVKQKTLDEMLQELPGAGQFIIVMDTWKD